jgi:acyl-Coa thioesterase superfamily protein/acyl-CoA thioesterase superfamily protein
LDGDHDTADPPAAKSAFYESRRGGFVASELTRGPWDPDAQHAGPPAALLGREVERVAGIGDDPVDRIIGRITFEILAPVPIATVRARAEVVRPGRRVDMVEATLTDDDGEPLIRARAWRLLRRRVELPPSPPPHRRRPPPPGELETNEAFFPTGYDVGYHRAMEGRFVSGSFIEPGPAVAWMRMRHPLVTGEDPSPLQRVLVAADSGNGVSAPLDFRRFVFVNVDLTVHLARMPVGEWVCLDAATTPEPSGVGLTGTVLHDEDGPIGLAAQTLLVAER